jgi:NAD(P)-dependent dehydrogenase (short-subunit alcohol dehydrogenase family)
VEAPEHLGFAGTLTDVAGSAAITDLRGVRELVTGSTSGLGRAMAQALAQAGAHTVVTSRDRGRAEEAAEQLGGDALGIAIDARHVTATFRTARAVVPRILEGGGGRLVTISMSTETMTRRGFVPYGPAGAGVEALAGVMAADLTGTAVTANILLPGGATRTGMVPEEVSDEVRARPLDPSIMGPPIVWLASPQAAGVDGERIIATEFEKWLARRQR